MANLNETATWEAGIYQLERTDRLDAGVNGAGVSNRQAAQLANRTKFLRQAVETEVTQRAQAVSGEASARTTAINSAISAEQSARNNAIASAIQTEGTARDTAIQAAITSLETQLVQLVRYSVDPAESGLRLTANPSEAVPRGDVHGPAVYLVPYRSQNLVLWDGAGWARVNVSAAPWVDGLAPNRVYDVFGYLDGGVAKLEAEEWYSEFQRYFELSRKDGVLVSGTGSLRRFLGTVLTDSSGRVRDTIEERHIWNCFNQVPRPMSRTASGDWTYTTKAWRMVQGTSASRLTFVCGEPTFVEADAALTGATLEVGGYPATGIGHNAVLNNSANIALGVLPRMDTRGVMYARLTRMASEGRNQLNWLEYGHDGMTFRGRRDGGECGLTAVVLG